MPSIKSKTWTSEQLEKIAEKLDLKAETPSEGHTETQSWSRNREEVLLERGYGISYEEEVATEVETVIVDVI